MYVSHQASPLQANRTACGQPWQQWQAHEDYADGSLGTLPPPVHPPGKQDEVAECAVCDAVLRQWAEDEPVRRAAQERLEKVRLAREQVARGR